MYVFTILAILSLQTVHIVNGWNFSPHFISWAKLRRSILSSAIVGSLTCNSPTDSFAANLPQLAAEQKTTPVYFGIGCFWHVQHEFVQAERKILGRGDSEYTALAGYAGGKTTGKNGEVCYHNMQGAADYGSLGHGEVVNVNIPEDKYKLFAEEYLQLFGKDLERPDKGDRGPEYRSIIGLPGGTQSKLYPIIANLAKEKGLTLEEGRGNDGDTLYSKKVWVMDSDKYPFHQAEIYHQYHDGFMLGEQYPQSYNDLKIKAVKDGRIAETKCPDNSFLF